MIVLRALQGFFGGVLIPMAFTITLTMLPRSQAADRPRDVRAVRHLRARDRPDHRRLSHRELRLAVHLLRQPGARRDHAGDAWPSLPTRADAASACCGRATGPASPRWRSASPRCRPCWRKATRTTGSARRSSSGLSSSPPSSLALFFWIELTSRNAAAEPAPAAAAQFRARQLRQRHPRHRAVWLGLSSCRVYLSQMQGYNSEQIGEVLAWTGLPQLVLIPLVPLPDAARSMRACWSRIGFALFAASNFMNTRYHPRLLPAPQLLRGRTWCAPSGRRW